MLSRLVTWLKQLFAAPPHHAPGHSPFQRATGPARVVLLRHAEKTGEKSDPHLSRAGQQRAQALVRYLPETFGTPAALFAARSSKKSRRPVETLEPLANALGLAIMDAFDDEDVEALVDHLGDAPECRGQLAVISWRHSDIPRLAATLGVPEGSFPEDWDEREYKLIIEIVYRDGAAPQARQIVQPF